MRKSRPIGFRQITDDEDDSQSIIGTGSISQLTSEEHSEAGDDVRAPAHYRSHPSGVECIEITKHFSFCIGNVIKYCWRAGLKTSDPLTDLKKAREYLNHEIGRLEATE